MHKRRMGQMGGVVPFHPAGVERGQIGRNRAATGHDRNHIGQRHAQLAELLRCGAIDNALTGGRLWCGSDLLPADRRRKGRGAHQAGGQQQFPPAALRACGHVIPSPAGAHEKIPNF